MNAADDDGCPDHRIVQVKCAKHGEAMLVVFHRDTGELMVLCATDEEPMMKFQIATRTGEDNVRGGGH